MDQVPERVMQWWRTLDDTERRRATFVALCGIMYLVHYLVYCIPQPFFIEDAAITYAYAKNLVDGEGLVPFPGAERVEGYSNALWTFLGAGFYALGVPLWTSAKLMGAALGVATLPIVYELTRRMRPNGSHDVALLAPLMLALHPSFVVWNASGLENSLFCFLLAGSSLRLIRESEDDSLRPWSALGFFLLTMTRPEGIMYATLGGVALVLYAVADRKPARVLWWVLIFAVPFALYNGWRYWYFAWELPNTYYAKLGVDRFKPFLWTNKGWKYINNYLVQYGIVFGLPLLFFALGGAKDLWRRRVSVALVALLALLIFWDAAYPKPPADWAEDAWPRMPDWWRYLKAEWIKARVYTIAGVSGLMGLMTLTWPGWRARGILWCHCTAGVFFALYSGGDWMNEWRWFNIVSISLLPLLAVGLGEVLDALVDDDWTVTLPAIGWTVAARHLFLLAVAVPFLGRGAHRAGIRAFNPETSVRDIHRRVYYMHDVQRQLDVDHITLLDVDMGAHLLFSGWEIVDIAGLVDVPMARHSDFNRKFIMEYIFDEKVPDFAHVHAGWARQSRIDKPRIWKDSYIEIPGYPLNGRQLHIGNHIRRDLFIEPFSALPESGVINFTGEVQLLSHAVPSPEVAPGSALHLRTWWHAEGREDGFRAIVFLDDGSGSQASIVVEPGYGWYPAEEWKVDEKVAGRFWIPIPADLPTGTYRLGMALMDEATGKIIQRRPSQDGPPAYIVGETWLDATVQIVTPDEARSHAEADHAAALAAAAAGDCEKVWPRFKDATRHLSDDADWRAPREEAAREALALCHIRRAEGAEDRDEKIPHLLEARKWDHRAPGLSTAVRPVVIDLETEGEARVGQGDHEGAYQAWSKALALDPSRSWTRRKAEAARDKRLGITRPGEKKPEPPKPRVITPQRRTPQDKEPADNPPDPTKAGEI